MPRYGGPKYTQAHQRVRRSRGPASSYQCALCPRQAYAWALDVYGPTYWDAMPYSDNPDDYTPLCGRCHKRKDMPVRDVCVNGHDNTPESGNLRVSDYGHRLSRSCRVCNREDMRERRKASPRKSLRIPCSVAGCDAKVNTTNLTGLCRAHRKHR